MFFTSKRLTERAEGLDLLREILKDKNKSVVIHYSCESFVTTHGRTPRVTSICMRYLGTAQTKSFSIHLAFPDQYFELSEYQIYKLRLLTLVSLANSHRVATFKFLDLLLFLLNFFFKLLIELIYCIHFVLYLFH